MTILLSPLPAAPPTADPASCVDVLSAAWLGAGRPVLDPAGTDASPGPVVSARPDPARADGGCCRCGRADLPMISLLSVVSKAFHDVDGWRPAGRALCPACGWAFGTQALRRHPHLVATDPARLRQLTRGQLRAVLSAGPLPPDVAVVVPLRPGRKHLLHRADWGRVTVEDAALPWTAADVERLAALHRLRELGVGSRQLAQPAPPWLPALAGRYAQLLPQLQQDWDQLAPWRARPQWLALAVLATSTTPAQPAAA